LKGNDKIDKDQQFNLEVNTESDSNEESVIETYAVFHSSDCASGWGKKEDPRKCLSIPLSVIQNDPHSIPFVPFFSAIQLKEENESFEPMDQQIDLVNRRLLDLFPLMASFCHLGEGDLFSAIAILRFVSASKRHIVSQQCAL
jgi:hypothetical protein